VIENGGGFTKPQASNLLSFALIIFTVGRFVAVGIAFFLAPAFIMIVYSTLVIVMTVLAIAIPGTGGVAALMVTYFLMAPMYPTIFTLGTASKFDPRTSLVAMSNELSQILVSILVVVLVFWSWVSQEELSLPQSREQLLMPHTLAFPWSSH